MALFDSQSLLFGLFGSAVGGFAGDVYSRRAIPNYVPVPESSARTEEERNKIVMDNAFGPTRVSNERSSYIWQGSTIGLLGGLLLAHVLSPEDRRRM